MDVPLARDGGARESPPSAAPSRRVLAAPWQCGKRRLALRQRFNTRELDAATILRKYDADSSGSLDAAELKSLMQDCGEGSLVAQADVDYFLKVADVDHDGTISRSEVLHGLKAWFALRNLPKAVDLALKERADGALPSAEAFRELLQDEVNESQPVSLDEAEQVRGLALVLGATEESVTQEQLRGAVADWYLQIEREETSAGQLGKKSLESSVHRVKEIASGNFQAPPNVVMGAGILFLAIGVLLPLLEIAVAQSQDHRRAFQCEHPHMSLTLRTTGFLTLATSVSLAISWAGGIQGVPLVKVIFAGLAIVLLVILLTMEVYGVLHVSSSTSARCGLGLWSTCYFVYCVFPFCTAAFLFFGAPCLFVREYLRTRDVDHGLTVATRRSRGVNLRAPDGPAVAIEKLREVEQWQCGAQRLALRKKFNTQEIDAAKIIRRYDRDESGVLEIEELQELLHDYNGRKPVSQEDLDYVMVVSDVDQDNTISRDEVLSALRVWYAFRNMPKAVGQAFTKHQVSDGPMPAAGAMTKLLITLNDSQPVTEQEVAYVRSVCLALGATEEKVTAAQLRRAVATWYLHIKRPETSKAEIVHKSIHDVRDKLANVREHAKRVYHGEIDYHSLSALVLMGLIVFLALLHPLLELLVATGFPSPVSCEYPELSSKLWWTGITTLTVTIASMGFALVAVNEKLPEIAKRVALGIFCLLLAVLLAMEVFGLLYAISSTAARCGVVLWTFCHFTYVVVPLLTLFALCCGMPCLFFVEYFDNTAVDGGLDGVVAEEA